jgi:hypothetical protein
VSGVRFSLPPEVLDEIAKRAAELVLAQLGPQESPWIPRQWDGRVLYHREALPAHIGPPENERAAAVTFPASRPGSSRKPSFVAAVLAVLAEHAAGLSTAAVAKCVRRRRAEVLAALEAAELAGLVERLPPAGQAHARLWRLRRPVETPSGTTREQRQAAETAEDDTEAVPAINARRNPPKRALADCSEPDTHRGRRWKNRRGTLHDLIKRMRAPK